MNNFLFIWTYSSLTFDCILMCGQCQLHEGGGIESRDQAQNFPGFLKCKE